MADSTRRKAKPVAWAMRFPNCDGSADWVELGEQMPQQWQGAVPSPLYDDAAIDAAVEQANARQNAAWRLMCDKIVAAERERLAAEIATLKRERDAAKAEAETAYDVCGPMVGKCQACGHEHVAERQCSAEYNGCADIDI